MLAYYWGGLTVAAPVFVVAFVLSHSDRDEAFGFEPFRVSIEFKRDFLTETGVATESQLGPPATYPPATEYWPRRDGISFTVLRLSLFRSEGNLIYWNDTRSFSTKLDYILHFNEFERDAPEGSLVRQLGKDTITPYIEIEPVAGGLEPWVAASESQSDRRLAVVIPHCVFGAARLREGNLKPRKRDAVLKRHGWTEDEPADLGEYGRIPGDFQHRYLTVSVRYI